MPSEQLRRIVYEVERKRDHRIVCVRSCSMWKVMGAISTLGHCTMSSVRVHYNIKRIGEEDR